MLIDIFGELVGTSQGHRYLLVINNRFTKLVKVIPLCEASAAEVVKPFLHHRVFIYGPLIDLIAEICRQLRSKLFLEVC